MIELTNDERYLIHSLGVKNNKMFSYE